MSMFSDEHNSESSRAAIIGMGYVGALLAYQLI